MRKKIFYGSVAALFSASFTYVLSDDFRGSTEVPIGRLKEDLAEPLRSYEELTPCGDDKNCKLPPLFIAPVHFDRG